MPFPRVAPWLLLFAPLLACKQTAHHRAEHSFYYWKTTYRSDLVRTEQLDAFKPNHFYIHYFDVDWSEPLNMPVPKAAFGHYFGTLPLVAVPFTPVVFITNRTFEMTGEDSIDSLAARITKKINAITVSIDERLKSPVLDGLNVPEMLPVTEIQIDCDWTPGTRRRYFKFLETFKRLNPGISISVTIRLYPYKYRDKMGIPPADKGILMCYNMDKISAAKTVNAVFDIAQIKQYLTDEDYPLPLDLAFPVFGWYAWFRDDRFKNIVYDNEELTGLATIFHKENNNRYRILKDTVINDNYFREGDILRKEFPDQQELRSAIKLMTARIPQYRRIAFYYWNTASNKQYESIIQETFDHF